MDQTGRPTVFLDRDGTINRDFGYVIDPARVELFPGAAQALGELKRAGYSLVIVSNQSAVARGMCELEAIERTNAELLRQLSAEDPAALVDKILFCPHHPDEKCPCRKPGILLVTQAESGWKFDRNQSWMVGDKCSDIEFGLRLGLESARCLMVGTGSDEAEQTLARSKYGEDVPILPDLAAVAVRILSWPAHTGHSDP